MPTYKFLVSTERVNSYGFVLENRGLEVEDFIKNPICLYNHNREIMPIGKWKNLTLTSKGWEAELEFDARDAFARLVEDKVAGGYLNAVSVGVRVLEADSSQEPVRATRARLREISITDIPSNKESLRLYDEDGRIVELSEQGGIDLNQVLKLNKQEEMTEEEKRQLAEAQEAAGQLKTQLEQALTELQDLKKSKQSGEQSEQALAELQSLREELQTIRQSQVTLSDLVQAFKQGSGVGKAVRADWTFSDWHKKDPQGLAKMRQEQPEQYQELVNTIKL